MLKQSYAQLMQKPAWLVVILTGLMLFFLTKIPELHIDVSSDSLVLQGDESLDFYRQIQKNYKSSGDFLLLTFRPKNQDIFNPESIRQVAVLQQQLEQLPNVAQVTSYLTVPLLYSPKVDISHFKQAVHYLTPQTPHLDWVKKEFQQSPIYKNLLSNQQGSVTALQVNLKSNEKLVELRKLRDSLSARSHKTLQQRQQLKEVEAQYQKAKQQAAKQSEQLVKQVRKIRDEFSQSYHAKIFIGGLPMIVADMVHYVKSDMLVFGSLAVLFIVLTMIVIFRSVRWVILPLLACFYTCAYMLGGLALLGINLTIVSANFVALLIILTLAMAIHLVVKFTEYQRLKPNLSQRQLVMLSVRYIFVPCCYTTATTMAAFLSLVSCLIPLVMNFGWTMMAGMVVAFVVSFTFLPATLLLLGKGRVPRRSQRTADFTHVFAYLVEHHRLLLHSVCVAAFVFGVFGISRLQVESRFIDYFSPETEIYQGMMEIDKDLGGTLPLDIVINHKPTTHNTLAKAAQPESAEDDFFSDEVEGFAESAQTQISYWFTRQGMQEVEKVQQYLQSLPEVGKVLSIATLYEVFSDLLGGNIDDVQLAIIKNNLPAQVDDSLLKPYLSKDGLQTRISLRVKETDKSLNHSALLKQIQQFMQDQGYKKDDYQLTGMMVLYNNLLQSLFISQAISFVIVFIVIFLMLAYLFRSFVLALAAMIPNVLAAMFVLALMGVIGFPLDIMTISIASITLGIGVDDTIHYIHRFRKEWRKDGNYIKAMYRSHASTGLAMFYTSVIIIIGFSILIFSNFTPSVYFGFLTGVAMLVALVGALLILPHLMVCFRPFNQQKINGQP